MRVVNLEVVVTDGKGERMLGLGPEDFELRVNGKDPAWCGQVAGLALREMLRHTWFRANLADLEQVGLVPRGMEPSPCPPEVLTLLTRPAKTPPAAFKSS